MIEIEIWKDIPGYENRYQVSNTGKVKSLNYKLTGMPQEMKPAVNRTGYPEVYLALPGRKRKLIKVHSLVTLAFLGEREEGMVVNHKDRIRHNNNLSNLEYCTQSQNCIRKNKPGSSSKHKGVWRNGDKWMSCINYEGKRTYIGYGSEDEMAILYNKFADELHGRFAVLNNI